MEQQGRVRYLAPDGATIFDDDDDHFQSAVLRLMRMDVAEFELWLAEIATTADPLLLPSIGPALLRRRPPPPRPGGERLGLGPDGEVGHVWHSWVARAPSHGVARSRDGQLGWLVRPSAHGWITETNPPAYDSAYFEKGQATTVYGDYFAERGWRIDKARRQLAAIEHVAPRPVRRALDVGSGHGYFRVALAEAAIDHEGADVSSYAAEIAKREYGFDTFLGDLRGPPSGWEQGFDLVTLWDVIEHVSDARTFLATVARLLKPGGTIALRTPNLDCPEAEILGPHYHSLQRPHLLYFTPRSVRRLARDIGLEPVRVDTVSHLLRGFVGQETVDDWAAEGRGADLTAYLVKA